MVESVNAFSFAKTPEIVFGERRIASLGKLISVYGNQIALITGSASYKNSSIKSKVEKSLKESDLRYMRYPVHAEPSPDIIDSAVSEFKNSH